MSGGKLHKQEKSLTYHELFDALKAKGCPVCTVLVHVMQAYMANLLYENVNDVALRERLRRSKGFCDVHANLLMAQADHFGIAVMYEDILRTMLDDLNAAQFRQDDYVEECPACAYRNEREDIYIATLAGHIHDGEIRAALAASDGLCLPHLGQLFHRVHDEDLRRELLDLHASRVAATGKDLAGFVRKQDIRHKDEALTPGEQSACDRAIDFMVGKNV